MVAYHEFVALSQSPDSEERGQAAHIAAHAYIHHQGPADEQAALYAALIGFLDDPSVKVRAALAYGLLHAANAPRSVMLALLRDSMVISRAVLQYCPVLVDADLMALVRDGDMAVLLAVAQRERLSQRLAQAVISRGERAISLRLVRRMDIGLGDAVLADLAASQGDDAEMRGALLARRDLPAAARLLLVQKVTMALSGLRIVRGALAPERLERLLRNGADTAVSTIGEREAVRQDAGYAVHLVASNRLNTRILLHAVVSGHVMFFADCLAELSVTPRNKVFAVLETGSRSALNALLSRCGLREGVLDLFVRLVMLARTADLADDVSARHYVVTALTEELIAEYDGALPGDLEEAFTYLSEQNIILARKAARGVMAAFAGETRRPMVVPLLEDEDRAALSAA